MPNRLSAETSPYLLQHAHNPVDWYPWGDAALALAEAEERPILLSIGYSSCHWCHVMERESFEDPTIAALMNRLYVNIKVDREERPDIDQIYMKAVQAMTGRGGWPMTVFLTPDRVPFFGGTYYPPEPRPGMPSFPQVLEAVHDAWVNRREEVSSGAERLLGALRATTSAGRSGQAGADELVAAVRNIQSGYDARWGGFGAAPKFPQPVTLDFLIQEHLRTEPPHLLEQLLHTLRSMASGGLRDHLGGGFHRYSVDERWLVPHFEKMLYDNALLARVYLDAWRVTDSDDLREVAESTLNYVLEDMTDADGRFYSARDADSEGEEGLFYVWTASEVADILEAGDASLFGRTYDISAAGNFEGRNIPHLPHPLPAVAEREGLSLPELEERLASARTRLLEHRADREHPFRDEKALTSWNGFAIRALAEAGAALGRADYLDAATAGADRIWTLHRSEGRLLHSSLGDEAKIPAFLDDHAALGNAYLSLHAATLDPSWFERAAWLGKQIVERFWDDELGGLYDTASDAERLIVRPRDPMDNATPSGSSLAAELFARLAQLTDEEDARDRARTIIDREAGHLGRFSPAFGRMLVALERLVAPSLEIVLSAPDDDSVLPLLRTAHGIAHPSLVISGAIGGMGPDLPLLQGRLDTDRATAFVCSGHSCRRPVHTPDDLVAEVRALLQDGG